MEFELERTLADRGGSQRNRFVERVAQADVDIPIATGVVDGSQVGHRYDEVVPGISGQWPRRAMDTAGVERDSVSECVQERSERTVEVVSVAAATLESDPRCCVVRINAPPLAAVDPQRLVRDALGMATMQSR